MFSFTTDQLMKWKFKLNYNKSETHSACQLNALAAVIKVDTVMLLQYSVWMIDVTRTPWTNHGRVKVLKF